MCIPHASGWFNTFLFTFTLLAALAYSRTDIANNSKDFLTPPKPFPYIVYTRLRTLKKVLKLED